MTLRSATLAPGLLLAPFLVLSSLANVARAGECHHCSKTYFCRPKPPCIKYHCVCPRPIGCGGVEHFGYYPTCWTAWPFPPDYSHCPSPPILAAVPSAATKPAPSQDQLPPPKTVPKSSQPGLE